MNQDNTIAESIAARLKESRKVAIFTHQRPDPDALGSQAAMAILLRRLGDSEVFIMNFDAPPAPYAFLQEQVEGATPTRFTPEWAATVGTTCDTIVVVDTCTYQQLEPAAEFLKSSREKIVALDHHLSRDDLSPLILADTKAAAAVEIVYGLISQFGGMIQIDPALALPLMSGLVADTGWFRFDSVTARTHEIAAALTPHLNIAALYQRLQQTETSPKLALMQRALASLIWSSNDRVAIMSLTPDDFAAAKAVPSQTEDLVNLPLMVATAQVSALLTQTPEGRIRGSLRSKNHVDVNKIANQFSGGGHAKAAGCRFDVPMPQAIASLQAAIEKML